MSMCDDFVIIEKNICSACRHSFDLYDEQGNWENACRKNSKLVAKDGGLTTCTWWCL